MFPLSNVGTVSFYKIANSVFIATSALIHTQTRSSSIIAVSV